MYYVIHVMLEGVEERSCLIFVKSIINHKTALNDKRPKSVYNAVDLMSRVFMSNVFKENSDYVTTTLCAKIIDSTAFFVTHAAKSMIVSLASAEDKQRILRIEVEAGGCNGYKCEYNMLTLDCIQSFEDMVFFDDIPLVVMDHQSFDMLKGATLDYETSLLWSGFAIVRNPQAKSSCSCGVSFG